MGNIAFQNLSADNQKKIYTAIKEASNALTRAQGEREYVRETVKKVCEETGIEKRLLNHLIKTFYKGTFDEEVAEQDAFERLYTMVTNQVNKKAS